MKFYTEVKKKKKKCHPYISIQFRVMGAGVQADMRWDAFKFTPMANWESLVVPWENM